MLATLPNPAPSANTPRLGHLLRLVQPWIDRAGSLIGLAWMLILAQGHLHIALQPGPQELNEPAAWYATWLLKNGRNPFDIGELPAAAQFFGPLYNYVVIALSPIFGTDYEGHRMVNFVCIAGVLALLGRYFRRAGTSWGVTWLALATVYGCVLPNIMITARPDALGWLFFMLAVLWPVERNFSRRSVLGALALGVLGFHCKAYFALGALPALIGVARRSPLRASLAGLAYVAVIALTLAVATLRFPMLYVETVPMQYGSATINSAPEFYDIHTSLLVERAWPFLLALAAALATFLARYPWRKLAAAWRQNRRWVELPSFGPEAVLGASLLVTAVIVQGRMAINGGASFTYHIHLLLPLFCLLLASWAVGWARQLFLVLCLVPCLLSWVERPWTPDSHHGYHTLETLLRPYHAVLGVSTTTDLLVKQGKANYNDGFTLFVPCCFERYGFGDREEIDAMRRAFEEQNELIEKAVRHHWFGVIVTHDQQNPFVEDDVLRQYYEPGGETFDVPMAFAWDRITLWYPKVDADAAEAAPSSPASQDESQAGTTQRTPDISTGTQEHEPAVTTTAVPARAGDPSPSEPSTTTSPSTAPAGKPQPKPKPVVIPPWGFDG